MHASKQASQSARGAKRPRSLDAHPLAIAANGETAPDKVRWTGDYWPLPAVADPGSRLQRRIAACAAALARVSNGSPVLPAYLAVTEHRCISRRGRC